MWSLAKKDKENRACQEAHSHAHIIQFDGLAYLFIFLGQDVWASLNLL